MIINLNKFPLLSKCFLLQCKSIELKADMQIFLYFILFFINIYLFHNPKIAKARLTTKIFRLHTDSLLSGLPVCQFFSLKRDNSSFLLLPLQLNCAIIIVSQRSIEFYYLINIGEEI